MRCIQCGTGLVNETTETTETTDAYRAAARAVDARMYGGIGAFVGFALTFVVLKFVLEDMYFDTREIYGGALAAAVVCGAAGRLIAHKKWK